MTLDSEDLQQIGDIVASKILDYFTTNPISNSLIPLDTKVDTLLTDVSSVKTTTTAINTTVGTINTNVNTVKTNTTTIKNDVTLIKPMIVDYFDTQNGTSSSFIDDLFQGVTNYVEPTMTMLERYFTPNPSQDNKTLYDSNIENLLSSINASHNVNVDMSGVDFSFIGTIVSDTLSNNVGQVIASASLNGYGAEFKDGDIVNVVGRDVVYSVNRSFFSMYADNAYTIHYDVISSNGQRMIVPEALLTRHTLTAS